MVKRFFDILFSAAMLFLLVGLFLIVWIGAAIDTKSTGFFLQDRVGQFGKLFKIFKFRSMHLNSDHISRYGSFIRKYKLDELPQLLNVLIGEMSIVGPRPDISGYYDQLKGEDRLILELKPGLTSEAAIKYVNEAAILKQQKNPLKYNDEIIFPDKVKMNLAYYFNHTFLGDLKIIWKTVLTIFK